MKGKKKGTYLLRLDSYNNGVEIAADSLDYLCAFVEKPFQEFSVGNIGILAGAIAAVNAQLRFMTHDLADNEIIVGAEDGLEYVVLEKSQVVEMTRLADLVDETIEILREQCHITLEVN